MTACTSQPSESAVHLVPTAEHAPGSGHSDHGHQRADRGSEPNGHCYHRSRERCLHPAHDQYPEPQSGTGKWPAFSASLSAIIIIMYIYHALINALRTHMIHINLNTIFCTYVESYQNNLHKVLNGNTCLLYTSPSPRDRSRSRMPSSA